MKADMVSKIAAESSDNRLQRERMTRKLVVLKAGFEQCKKHIGRPMTSQYKLLFALKSAVSNNSDLQHRPWHPGEYVSEDDSEHDSLYSFSKSEDVNARITLSTES